MRAPGLTAPPVVAGLSDNARGAAWMTLGMAGYVINDTLIKLAAEDLPLYQAIFLRGFLIVVVLLAWVAGRGELGFLGRLTSPLVAARIGLETLGTVIYLSALVKLPLAGLTAVMQVVPVAVTFAAARLLREPLSLHRVGAVIAGFGGVLLVIRPWSDGFSPWFLLGLVAVVVITVRELVTRQIESDTPSLVVALGTAVTVTMMGLAVSLVQGWGPMTARPVWLLAAAAAFLTVGYVASIITVRTGELGFSAPFRYTLLLFAIVLQVGAFGEVPDALTLIGAAIVVAAGLWTLTKGS